MKEQARQSVTDGHFVWPVRVYYEDTDTGGVVYYANYLRFMERARTEWLRSLGFEQDALAREAGVIFAVRSAALEYLRPARFNDLLQVDGVPKHYTEVYRKVQPAGMASVAKASQAVEEYDEDWQDS